MLLLGVYLDIVILLYDHNRINICMYTSDHAKMNMHMHIYEGELKLCILL